MQEQFKQIPAFAGQIQVMPQPNVSLGGASSGSRLNQQQKQNKAKRRK